MNRYLVLITLSLVGLGAIGCAQTTNTANPVQESPTTVATSPSPAEAEAAEGDLTQLFSKVWRVTAAPTDPAPGSIYVFLPNGTLLQTSCVETYAIFPWTVDKETPTTLQVSENGQPAYAAEILELTDTTLRLQQNLILSNETQEITLTAVEEAFVCPDLPR